jgi:integrase
MIGLIKTGTDPNEPERVDESPTVAKAFEDFVGDLNKRVKAGDRQPSTVAFYEKSFARFDKRIIKLPLTAISARRGLIKEAHVAITRKSGSVAADHSIITFRSLWNHARRTWPELPESPTIAVEMNRIPDRAESGMGLDDLKHWWSEVQKLRNPVRRQLSLFMLLTGLRSNDARTAKLEHLDENEKTLHVPQPKGGRKRAFDLPLSDAALGCIRCAREAWRNAGHPPSDYLFPSARGAGFLSSPRIERHLNGERDRSLPSGHKLRHTFATIAEACGFTEEVYGVLLNHRATTVTGKYPNRKKNVSLYRQVADDIARAIIGAIGNA